MTFLLPLLPLVAVCTSRGLMWLMTTGLFTRTASPSTASRLPLLNTTRTSRTSPPRPLTSCRKF
jgi:hypothetical protein